MTGKPNPSSAAQPRELFRHVALSALSVIHKRLYNAECWLTRPRVQILCLHHVHEFEESAFRELLHVLSIHHRFVSYREALRRALNNTIDAPYVAFTMDDGLECCRRAARILEEFGTRGCFFVIPSVLNEIDRRAVDAFCRGRLHIPPSRFLTWSDAEELLARGHEIGSHTMEHIDLNSLPPERVRADIESSFHELCRRLGRVEHFAWPYGRFRHFNAAAARAVYGAGFETCASAERGCHVNRAGGGGRLCIRRDHIRPLWPISHTMYFLSRNSRSANPRLEWPAGWDVEDARAISSSR